MTTFELILVMLYICNGLALYIAELPSLFSKKLWLTIFRIISGLIIIVTAWPTILIFKFVREEF